MPVSDTSADRARPAPKRFALLLLGFCFCLSLVSRGLVDSFGVFVLPLSAEFGWSRTDIASIFSLSLLVNGSAGPLVGTLLDRWGPRVVYLTGAIMLAASFALAPHLETLWQFRIGLGATVGLATCALGSVVHTAVVTPWFRERLGLAMAAIFAASGLGVMAIVPFTQLLVERIGWHSSYFVMSAVVGLVLLPTILTMPLHRAVADRPAPPEPARPAPDRQAPDRQAPDRQAPDRPATLPGEVWTLRRACGTRAFWCLFSIYGFTSFAMYGVTLQVIAYLIETGFPPLLAASAFGMTGLVSTVCIFGFGWLSDRIGRTRAGNLSFLLTGLGIVALLLIARFPSLWLLGVYVVLFGGSQGSRGPIVSGLTAKLFPGPHLGKIYGTISFGFGCGAAPGALVVGLLHDWTGGYDAGLLVSLAAMILGYVPFRMLPRDRHERIA